MTKTVEKCPVCQKASVQQYLPFCSKRCHKIDLGRWLTESYIISDPQEKDQYLGFLTNSHPLLSSKAKNKGIKALAGAHTIDLSRCPNITDKGMEALAGIHITNL